MNCNLFICFAGNTCSIYLYIQNVPSQTNEHILRIRCCGISIIHFFFFLDHPFDIGLNVT